jgi:hypothetical protein
MFKKIMFVVTFFLASTFSCSKTYKKIDETKPECEQILDVVTDCMDLHRGALDYVNNCGDANIEEIKAIKNCDEILEYIEYK